MKDAINSIKDFKFHLTYFPPIPTEGTEYTAIGFDDGERAAILRFVARVNYYAEETIARTGVVEGAHWNALRRCLAEINKEEEAGSDG